MIRRSAAIALGALAVAVGCSGRSVVIGEDPNETGPISAPTGGVFGGGGTPITGGAFPTGGTVITGGTFPIGGTSTGAFGGTLAYGGTSAYGGASIGGAVNGGTNIVTGGTAGSGDGGIVDPYPRVLWEMGQGYRNACPRWGGTWGFTCWHYSDTNRSESCTLDGSVFCNACSCAVPCETSADCPPTLAGDEAACLAAPTNVPSCFVPCYPSTPKLCPDGMTCSQHPGTGDFVCVWVSDAAE